jgi:Mn-dependent DtxR family transcriptional regulator
MLKKLAQNGWVDYRVGTGARFTREGLLVSRGAIRRRRLIQLFFERVLGFDEGEARADAEACEHSVSARVEEAIAAYLKK